MFGTIGHARVKAGHMDQFTSLMEDWEKEIRPSIPGDFISIGGSPKDRPDEVVFVALAEDEPTYRALAASPTQDAFYRRMLEHLEGDVSWEDVQMEFFDHKRAKG
jgi:hypothetical protein